MSVKFALPTGDSRATVNDLLARAGIIAPGYEPGSRVLRTVDETAGMTVRVFREKDIPVQVAMGNYDLGITGDIWLSELSVRFPQQHVVRIGTLPGMRSELWLCAAPESGLGEGEVPAGSAMAGARIVSEFPNIADFVAIHLRVPAYRLLTVYGSADAYPPEDAELVLMPANGPEAVRAKGLVPLHRVFSGGLALVANTDALGSRGLGDLLAKLGPLLISEQPELSLPAGNPGLSLRRAERDPAVLRMAVPDGHAQRYAPGVLREIGLAFDGYDEKSYVRRPSAGVPGLAVKVVRPQDMPQLLAMGMFDIGISGVDLLHEHRCKFPSSPVEMAVDLGINRYRIGPVVEQAFPVDTTAEAIAIWNNLGRPVRIASEFPATAERFALDNHLRFTTIIPVAGASEGFVPEDADFLVEGTETGTSIRANGLKMLDPFMEATSCVVWRTEPVTTQTALMHDLVERLRASVSAAAVS
jgi:ATP phosphoribosyltransferase